MQLPPSTSFWGDVVNLACEIDVEFAIPTSRVQYVDPSGSGFVAGSPEGQVVAQQSSSAERSW